MYTRSECLVQLAMGNGYSVDLILVLWIGISGHLRLFLDSSLDKHFNKSTWDGFESHRGAPSSLSYPIHRHEFGNKTCMNCKAPGGLHPVSSVQPQARVCKSAFLHEYGRLMPSACLE